MRLGRKAVRNTPGYWRGITRVSVAQQAVDLLEPTRDFTISGLSL